MHFVARFYETYNICDVVNGMLSHTLDHGFARESLASYDGLGITLPERFRPEPAFLESHARRFQFL